MHCFILLEVYWSNTYVEEEFLLHSFFWMPFPYLIQFVEYNVCLWNISSCTCGSLLLLNCLKQPACCLHIVIAPWAHVSAKENEPAREITFCQERMNTHAHKHACTHPPTPTSGYLIKLHNFLDVSTIFFHFLRKSEYPTSFWFCLALNWLTYRPRVWFCGHFKLYLYIFLCFRNPVVQRLWGRSTPVQTLI
jgi:hypothetical protein